MNVKCNEQTGDCANIKLTRIERTLLKQTNAKTKYYF